MDGVHSSEMVVIHVFVAIAGVKDDDGVFVLLLLWWSVVFGCVHQMLCCHKALQLVTSISSLYLAWYVKLIGSG